MNGLTDQIPEFETLDKRANTADTDYKAEVVGAEIIE